MAEHSAGYFKTFFFICFSNIFCFFICFLLKQKKSVLTNSFQLKRAINFVCVSTCVCSQSFSSFFCLFCCWNAESETRNTLHTQEIETSCLSCLSSAPSTSFATSTISLADFSPLFLLSTGPESVNFVFTLSETAIDCSSTKNDRTRTLIYKWTNKQVISRLYTDKFKTRSSF